MCHLAPSYSLLTLYIGTETQAVVEFALYQKIPTEKSKADSRIATIEEGMFKVMSFLC
jgi:hypothetical protein